MAKRIASGEKPRKSALRREAILQSALRLFDAHGFANTSLDDIARDLGIKREGIYYYFKNKSEILLCIIRPQSEALVEGLAAIAASGHSPADKLYAAIRNHLEQFDRRCLEMTVCMRDVYLDDASDVRGEMARVWRTYEGMWVRLIADGQQSGEFARCGDPKMLAFGILGMCNWLARWYDPGKPVSIDELIETYFEMCAFGLVAAPGREARAGPGSAVRRIKAR